MDSVVVVVVVLQPPGRPLILPHLPLCPMLRLRISLLHTPRLPLTLRRVQRRISRHRMSRRRHTLPVDVSRRRGLPRVLQWGRLMRPTLQGGTLQHRIWRRAAVSFTPVRATLQEHIQEPQPPFDRTGVGPMWQPGGSLRGHRARPCGAVGPDQRRRFGLRRRVVVQWGRSGEPLRAPQQRWAQICEAGTQRLLSLFSAMRSSPVAPHGAAAHPA